MLIRFKFTSRLLVALCAALVVWPAVAQVLSSPIGNAPAAVAPGAPGAPAAVAPIAGLPAGKGAGTHGAGSPFAPLEPRNDVIPWSVLTDVKTKTEKNRIVPVFTASQMALRQKTQRIQGFMMPLEPGTSQRHFLLSSVPLTCAFCTPGGPESMVEVRTKTPVKYGMEPVVVEGKFLVLNDDSFGLYYRMLDAVSVK